MAAVEVRGIGPTMGNCFQGTAPDPVCSCIVGRAVGREASLRQHVSGSSGEFRLLKAACSLWQRIIM